MAIVGADNYRFLNAIVAKISKPFSFDKDFRRREIIECSIVLFIYYLIQIHPNKHLGNSM